MSIYALQSPGILPGLASSYSTFDVDPPVPTPLLLIGGQSSRMGTPKHLLTFPDGRLAYEHALETLIAAVPSAREILISVRDVEQVDGLNLKSDLQDLDVGDRSEGQVDGTARLGGRAGEMGSSQNGDGVMQGQIETTGEGEERAITGSKDEGDHERQANLHEGPHTSDQQQYHHPHHDHYPHHHHEDGHEHEHNLPRPKLIPIFDSPTHSQIGPAAGLLSAHARYSQATFLVLACDYPLLPSSALLQLIMSHTTPSSPSPNESPDTSNSVSTSMIDSSTTTIASTPLAGYSPSFPDLTCFTNAAGFNEPLIAIWGPEAIALLEENVNRSGSNGSGLNKVAGMLGERARRIAPLRSEWIQGTNTKEEWEACLEVLRHR